MKEELQKLIDNIKSDLDRIGMEKDRLFNDINMLYSFIGKNSLWIQSWTGNYTNKTLSRIMLYFNSLSGSSNHIEILHEGILDIIKYRRKYEIQTIRRQRIIRATQV